MNFKIIILSSIFLLAIDSVVYGQTRYVDVAPDASGTIGSLNSVIRGDTTETGERIDSENTVYRLERGGTYILNLAIRNVGFPLAIEAAGGDGEMPRIIPGVTVEGNSDVPFRPQNDFRLKGVFLTGRNPTSGLEDQLIRIQTEDVRVEIDSCFFDESSQSAIRTDTRGTSIFVTNTIIGRMGTPDDIDNGRVVDDRGNFIDTLVIENTTIYNITSRVVRNGSGADSYMNYCRFNNNTVMNVGQRMADFGPIINFIFTNNIIVNPTFNGVEVDPDPFNPDQPDPNARGTASIKLDTVDQAILDAEGVNQTAMISHNNIYFTQAVLDARPERDPDPMDNDFIVSRPTFSLTGEAFIEFNGTADSNIEEVLDFQNAPPDPVVFIQEFWANFDGSIVLSPWDNSGAPYDFSYPGAAVSATASVDGGQLGDTNWPLIVFSGEALEELIDEATILLNETAEGNNIGNVASFGVDSLEAAIAFAQEILDDPGATPNEIEATIKALEDAIDFFLGSIITGSPEILNPTRTRLFPNPATDFLQINANETIENISIFGMDGRQFGQAIATGQGQVDLRFLRSGIYILTVHFTNGESFREKILKY